MTDSFSTRSCVFCGGKLDEYDINHKHGACFSCRSPKGKLAELDIAICAEGDDPNRIPQWRSIRYWLDERFGRASSELALWERFKDRLCGKLRLLPNDYLRLSLDRAVALLASDSAFEDSAVWALEIEAISPVDNQQSASPIADANHVPRESDSAQKTSGVPESEEEQSSEAEKDKSEKQPFTLLDSFPASPAGHIEFIEFVHDEVHNAAEAKRCQLERDYSNATIESMVSGIKWTEARKRIAELVKLTELPTDAVEKVAAVLRRKLTAGTVEQIDKLLVSAVQALRDAWENRVGN